MAHRATQFRQEAVPLAQTVITCLLPVPRAFVGKQCYCCQRGWPRNPPQTRVRGYMVRIPGQVLCNFGVGMGNVIKV